MSLENFGEPVTFVRSPIMDENWNLGGLLGLEA